MSLNNPQPPPKPTDETPIWELVIVDMKDRDQTGYLKYGVRLTANNERDALVDAYQEALDLVVYLRQAIEERKLKLTIFSLEEITQRICDPGAFIPRGDNYSEPIPRWGARAVLALLVERLKGRLF